MHTALQIPEIRLQVFAQLHEHMRALLALALTCSSFRNPALDELWREPGENTIYYILRCFPADLLHLAFNGATRKLAVNLLRPVMLADWESPTRYCRRVRKYCFGNEDYASYMDALRLLAIWLPDKVLFPRLEHLEWNTHNSEAVGLLRLFLSPSLTSLGMSLPSTVTLSALPMISGLALPLTEIRIGDDEIPMMEDMSHRTTSIKREATGEFIRTLGRVRAVSVWALDCDTFRHLARFPGLLHLELLAVPRDTLPTLSIGISTPMAFRTLRTLFVARIDIPTALALLRIVSQSPLTEFAITPVPAASVEQIRTLYIELPTHLSPARLTSFEHECELDDIEGFTPWNLPGPDILTLTAFTRLTFLVLRSRGGFPELDDARLTTLLRALPELEELSVEYFDATTALTIAALLPLATHCARLVSAGLTFRATTYPLPFPSLHPDDHPDVPRPIQSALRALHVGFSPVSHALRFPVARLISGLFPGLDFTGQGEEKGIASSWPPIEVPEDGDDGDEREGVMYSRWRDIQERVEDLAEVREEERAWATIGERQQEGQTAMDVE